MGTLGGVNYVPASPTLTAGCGMSVLVDADGRPIVIPSVSVKINDNNLEVYYHGKRSQNIDPKGRI